MASVGGEGEGVSLNIMPMLDIFSILILFLLMNFSSDPMSHDLDQGVELPESTTIVSLDEMPSIRINKKEIFANDKKVADISGKDILENQKTQGAIYPLFEELEKMAEANKRFSKNDDKAPGTLTLQVDKGHLFSLLKRVMISAQQADFVKFKLMVSKEI